MSLRPRLVLFDVDGTLVDSQGAILGAMTHAFSAIERPVPPRAEVLGIVGLSLDRAIARLAPDLPDAVRAHAVEAYKRAYFDARSASADKAAFTPLYPGARATLDRLAGLPEVVLGVATGKSLRGLDALVAAHGLDRHFLTRQVADHHPSKPHPSTILTAMAETGIPAEDTVMIGDTRFDMDMARAAGVTGIGVTWGYHPVAALDADHVADTFDGLGAVLDTIWRAEV
jgi:phosphoglycolate phosphatase